MGGHRRSSPLFACARFCGSFSSTGDEIRVLSPNNLGDLSLHLTYIRQLANGVPFWPENPILAGAQLTYPSASISSTACSRWLGADVLRSFIWMGLAGRALTGVALWRWGGAFTLAGFLVQWRPRRLRDLLRPGGSRISRPTHRLEEHPARALRHPARLALRAARGAAAAVPVGARDFSATSAIDAAAAALGRGAALRSLPLFHLHTFLFLSLLLGSWFVLQATGARELIALVGVALCCRDRCSCCWSLARFAGGQGARLEAGLDVGRPRLACSGASIIFPD